MQLRKEKHSDKLNEYLKLNFLDKIHFISDTHFWHKNIIKYCNRPFADVDEMNSSMLASWRAKVKQNDIIIHVGDVFFGGPEKLSTMNQHLATLPGYKILIVGNHDYSYSKKLYHLNVDEAYEVLVFSIDGVPFRISHTPESSMNMTDDTISIHGHLHDKLVMNAAVGRYVNVCVEHHNYGPVSLQELLDKMFAHQK
jgi:calcineurin-like phosphoesterase family protein